MREFPKNVKKHWDNVAELGCIVSGGPATIHHAKGGSMKDNGFHSGWSQRGVSDALVLPLRAELHYAGPDAIDGSIGVRTWEKKFGNQYDMLHKLSEELGYDVFDLHRRWKEEAPSRG